MKQGAGWQANARNTRGCVFGTRCVGQGKRQLYADIKVSLCNITFMPHCFISRLLRCHGINVLSSENTLLTRTNTVIAAAFIGAQRSLYTNFLHAHPA